MLKMLKTAALGFGLIASTASAQGVGDALVVSLLPGWREADGTHMAGLHLDLSPGWKTYWRSPGDAGIPPRMDFSGSENVASVSQHWPVPEVFYQSGLRSIGYGEDFVVALRVAPRQDSQPLVLTGRIDLGVCRDICIPVSLAFEERLPATGQDSPSIRGALASRMMPGTEAGVGNVLCRTVPTSDGLRLTATVEMPSHGADEAAVIETSDPSIWVSEPDLTRDGNTLKLTSELVSPDLAPFALDRSSLRITVLSDGPAVDIRGCVGG
ncbi:MAG: protein-disulfide reductase DsbD domain-containing protein [Pseudomonadota bacterium]